MRRGDAELESDHFVDACRSYLMASQYYWLALSDTGLGMAERRRLEDAHVGAFRTALPSLPHATTPFVLDLDDARVCGYLFMPAGRASASLTVLWPVASCATAESSYWQIAAPLLDTDTACAVFAPNTEHSISAVARWARRQVGVDHLLLTAPAAAAQRLPLRSNKIRTTKEEEMATIITTHEVDDVQHWLSSTKRAEFFGQLGYTVRTFTDPTDEHRVGLIVEGPGLDPLLQAVQTPEGAAALKEDGVRADTIAAYVET